MTREQIVVLGFIVAAYVAGWVTAAVTSAVRRSRPPMEEVGDALRNDVANESMLSVLSPNGNARLSALELDLADWGFAYGVAWARAQDHEPRAEPDVVAAEALRAADEVFQAYTDGDDWREPIDGRMAQIAHSPSPRTTS